jgi:hypothetical protein
MYKYGRVPQAEQDEIGCMVVSTLDLTVPAVLAGCRHWSCTGNGAA